MKTIITFDDQGVGNGMAMVNKDLLEPHEHELPQGFSLGALVRRFQLVDGAVVDAYPDQTDEQVQAALEQAVAQVAATVEAVTLVERLALIRQKSLNDLAYQYDTRVQALASGYSQYERESWPIQTAEATAYSADPLALTPWLDAASAARGIDKSELAARVLAMDTAYRQIHGALTGHRQKLWDQVAVAQTVEDIAAIDVAAGWPA